jgi:hypothetical protein
VKTKSDLRMDREIDAAGVANARIEMRKLPKMRGKERCLKRERGHEGRYCLMNTA